MASVEAVALENIRLSTNDRATHKRVVDDVLARKLSGLLKERYVGTEPPNIFVDLQQHVVVLKIALPFRFGVHIQGVIFRGFTTGA